MKRTYTEVGKVEYSQKSIDNSIKKVKWVEFKTIDLPFCQGSCINNVIKECNIPLSKISSMDLHGIISLEKEPSSCCGFYALDVKYKNGQAQIYIADNGCSACVVASDFTPFDN